MVKRFSFILTALLLSSFINLDAAEPPLKKQKLTDGPAQASMPAKQAHEAHPQAQAASGPNNHNQIAQENKPTLNLPDVYPNILRYLPEKDMEKSMLASKAMHDAGWKVREQEYNSFDNPQKLKNFLERAQKNNKKVAIRLDTDLLKTALRYREVISKISLVLDLNYILNIRPGHKLALQRMLIPQPVQAPQHMQQPPLPPHMQAPHHMQMPPLPPHAQAPHHMQMPPHMQAPQHMQIQ